MIPHPRSVVNLVFPLFSCLRRRHERVDGIAYSHARLFFFCLPSYYLVSLLLLHFNFLLLFSVSLSLSPLPLSLSFLSLSLSLFFSFARPASHLLLRTRSQLVAVSYPVYSTLLPFLLPMTVSACSALTSFQSGPILG